MGDIASPQVNVLELINLPGLPFALLFLVLTWFIARVVNGFVQSLGERFSDRRLVLQQVATFARFAIWLSGLLLVAMTALRLTDQVVLALTGTIAVAVGFAFKDLAASIIAGIIILVDRPFQVGDRVTFGGVYGEITGIGLRSVRLTTLDDNVVTIPNNKFLTDIVSSGNYGELDMLVQMDFYVAGDQDLRVARGIIEDCLTASRFVYTRKPWRVAISQQVIGGMVGWRLRAMAYVLDVKYEKSFESDVHERVAEEFALHGVRPPDHRVGWTRGAGDALQPLRP
jgi:small-conductance mechanosensitive channel